MAHADPTAAARVDERDEAAGNDRSRDERHSATLAVITSHHPRTLAKRYTRDDDGNLDKQSAGALARGTVERVDVSGPRDFADLIASLATAQALTFGVPNVDAEQASIASREQAGDHDVTRTRDCFDWPAGPGWLLLDVDADETPADAYAKICAAVPALADAPAVAVSSASGYVYDGETGEQLRGPGGVHVYIMVTDARDIPRAGSVVHEQLWLAGHGRYDVSRSGQLLDRSLVDAAVWQPERLDYAAGAACDPPLEQRRPDPVVHNADAEPEPLDTATALPDLAPAERERVAELREHAAAAVRDEQRRVREQWIAERVANADDEDERERLRNAVERGRLHGDFELAHRSGEHVTVAELLDEPERWHGERFADPLEPDYRDDPRVAYANLRGGGRPCIYSHAHGGQRFDLIRQQTEIKCRAGDMPRMLGELEHVLRRGGEVYEREGEMVRVLPGGRTDLVTSPWLRTHAEEIALFTRYDGNSKKRVAQDCPGDLAQRVLHDKGRRGLPELRGVARGPLVGPDGRLIAEPGHDSATGILLLAEPDSWPTIPDNPTDEQVRDAARKLWEPFALFPFKSPVDAAVQLQAMFTTVQRTVLSTAPATGYSAQKAGSGKTKAAQATCWLSGEAGQLSPWPGDAEEQRKSIMSTCLDAPAGKVWDNIEEPVASPALNGALTSPTYSDRKMATQQTITAPVKTTFFLTGNNLIAKGDVARRMYIACIDHGIEDPEHKRFPFDPVARVRERWHEYRAAAVTILRAYHARGVGWIDGRSVGSFEEWNALVRQPVLWLRDSGLAPVELGDPQDAIVRNYDHDPETQQLVQLLHAWHAWFGEQPKSTRDLADVLEPDQRGGGDRTDLADVLLDIAGERGRDALDRLALGKWIGQRAGRICDGFRLVERGSNKARRRWAVEAVQPRGEVRDAA